MIVADSSAIISLATNCLSPALALLNTKIFVTPTVYNEVVVNPMNSKRYALESLRIKKLFSEHAIEIKEPDDEVTRTILNCCNSVFESRHVPLNVIHRGEAEVMALAKEIKADAILVDERTTRLFIEDPVQLKGVLTGRINREIHVNNSQLKKLSILLPDVPILRSAEVAAVAYERGILDKYLYPEKNKVLEAVLYSLKFSGCSISWDEIKDYLRLVS